MRKLSRPQLCALARLSRRPNGREHLADHLNGTLDELTTWWSTMRALEKRKLVKRVRGSRALVGVFEITPAGVAAIENAPRTENEAEGSSPWRGTA